MLGMGEIKCHVQKVAMVLILSFFNVAGNEKEKGVIYIVLWTSADKEPFSLFEGQAKEMFFNRRCAYQNCFFTNNTSYFADVTLFDVIIFNIVTTQGNKSYNMMPTQRTNKQLYIFFSIEPAEIYPLSPDFNEFFNLTWTYRFDSNLTFSYLTVKSNKNIVIGPRKNTYALDRYQYNETNKQLYYTKTSP